MKKIVLILICTSLFCCSCGKSENEADVLLTEETSFYSDDAGRELQIIINPGWAEEENYEDYENGRIEFLDSEGAYGIYENGLGGVFYYRLTSSNLYTVYEYDAYSYEITEETGMTFSLDMDASPATLALHVGGESIVLPLLFGGE